MLERILIVSVPIWGLFNLTDFYNAWDYDVTCITVSVPIWGLFNLTFYSIRVDMNFLYACFRPHLGII